MRKRHQTVEPLIDQSYRDNFAKLPHEFWELVMPDFSKIHETNFLAIKRNHNWLGCHEAVYCDPKSSQAETWWDAARQNVRHHALQ